VLIWSGWVVISRLGVFQTLNSYDIMALRFGVASVAVAPFVWRFWPRQLKWWQLAFIACGQGIPYLLFAFGGFQFAPAAHAGIIMNGFLPVLAAMIGWVWLKEAPGSWRAVGIAIIVAGCVLTSWDTASAGVGPDAWKGHLLFVAAACMVAAYMVATKAWELRPRQAMVCIPVINLVAFMPVYALLLPKGIYRADWSENADAGPVSGAGTECAGRAAVHHCSAHHRAVAHGCNDGAGAGHGVAAGDTRCLARRPACSRWRVWLSCRQASHWPPACGRVRRVCRR
jgi:drug/metabolite transporter (DMT)-like permease